MWSTQEYDALCRSKDCVVSLVQTNLLLGILECLCSCWSSFLGQPELQLLHDWGLHLYTQARQENASPI